jgi:hypothetical protein
MLYWPRQPPCNIHICTHHNPASETLSQVQWGVKSVGRFNQVLGLSVTIFPDMCLVRSNAWHRYPHVNPYSNFVSWTAHPHGSVSTDHHRSVIKMDTTNSWPRTSARKITQLLPRSLVSIAATRPSILVSISKSNREFMQLGFQATPTLKCTVQAYKH